MKRGERGGQARPGREKVISRVLRNPGTKSEDEGDRKGRFPAEEFFKQEIRKGLTGGFQRSVTKKGKVEGSSLRSRHIKKRKTSSKEGSLQESVGKFGGVKQEEMGRWKNSSRGRNRISWGA